MKKFIKNILNFFYDKFRKYRNKFEFKRNMRKNSLYSNKLNREQKNQIKNLYAKYGYKVGYIYHSWYSAIYGNFSPMFIPDWLFYGKIENYFNDNRLSSAYSDKNIYDSIMPFANFPSTLIRNMGGVYFDEKYNILKECEVIKILENEDEFVIKPSIDSGGGKNVCLVTNGTNLHDTLNKYTKNFIIQKKLIQHNEFSIYNSSSVNIVRLISLWFEDRIQIISAALRVGVPGSFTDNYIDNKGRSMLTIGIDDTGNLKEYAYFANGDSRNTLLNNYKFKGTKVYCYDEMKELAIKLHRSLPHFKMISWDMTVDKDGRVTVMEYNIRSQGITYYQYVNGPLFGSLTEKILVEISKGN